MSSNSSNSCYDEINRKMISIVSYELKSPFNNILGISNLILKDDRLKQQDIKTLVVSIRDTALRSIDLLDNLLHTMNIQEQDYINICDNINVEKLVRNSIDFYRFQLDQKNLLIILNLVKGLEIKATKNILDYIFRNLLNNAIKFSNIGGRIEITSRIKDDLFELEVIDNGIGMSLDSIDRVFQDDDIKSNSGSFDEFGSDIGLKLCYHYVKKLNGNMVIGSIEGKGSKIIIKLPVR